MPAVGESNKGEVVSREGLGSLGLRGTKDVREALHARLVEMGGVREVRDLWLVGRNR